MTHPKVIVLILSYNGKHQHLLDDSVSSYLANDYPNFEVVVIDNGSTDGTSEYVQKKWPEVFVLRTEKNLGYSGGFNFGLEYAFGEQNADYVLITNNDVQADSKVITELIKVAEQGSKIGFVIGKVYYFARPNTLQTVGKKYDPILFNAGHIGNREKDEGQYDKIEERAWCDDIYWLVKRELYEKTGGYDTELAFQAEDFEWQVRAKKLGYKIMYTPHAKLWHKESMTIGKTSPFKAYYDARNPLIVHFKHRTPEQVKYFLYHKLKGNLRYTFKNILKLKFMHSVKMWQGFSSALLWAYKNNKLSVKNFL
jgi:hypothetical protein